MEPKGTKGMGCVTWPMRHQEGKIRKSKGAILMSVIKRAYADRGNLGEWSPVTRERPVQTFPDLPVAGLTIATGCPCPRRARWGTL